MTAVMEAAESNLVPGYRLDRYELLCPIASGGMASVWLARLRGKRGFEKLFAIKTIKTELTSDPSFQEMFLDEARIASRIIHPNVAQILELGEQADVLYLVMEYVDGDSVAKIARLALKRSTPLPPGLSLRIIADACAGLHAAHQLKDNHGDSLGVVHRDVSPQNLLITTEGSTKVIDFGLVKAKNRSAGETGQGIVKGKIRYMAPEQVHAKGVDHRADVWAAGMCLYELLVGHAPYHDEDDVEVVKRLMGSDPAPRLDVALPPAIEKVLAKALVKDPDARFQSCAQMRRAIDAAIDELRLEAEPEHVAEFLSAHLPELADKRQRTIAQATIAADSRLNQVESLEGHGPGDIAFAATEVSAREKLTAEDAELPLTRRVGPAAPREDSEAKGTTSSYGASRSTSATRLRDQIGERKRRVGFAFWVGALAVAGAGGWMFWPRQPLPDARSAASASASSTSPPAPASALPSASAAAVVDASTVEIDDDTSDDPKKARSVPTAVSTARTSPVPAADLDAGVAAPKPTYNPAWSILTNPPDAAAYAPAPTTSAAPPPPDDSLPR